MKIRLFACAVFATSVALVLGSSTGAQEKKDQKKDAAPEMAPPKPGPEHKVLAKLAGKWDAKVKMWMGPGDPKESAASASRSLIMGGLYLKEDVVGDMFGMKFTGMGIVGYDVDKKKYLLSWIDNFGTTIMLTQGDYNESAKTLTYVGEEDNPAMGGKMKIRDVLKFVSDDQHVFEMYRTPLASGKEMKIMELTFTRAAPKKK